MITCFYQAKLGEIFCNVSVTWCKSLTSYSLTIKVDKKASKENHYTCKIDLKNNQFWGKKGLKSFAADGERVDLFWDFRLVKFSSSPEPCSDYYVALVCKEEMVLLLGDLEDVACKRTRARPSLEGATLLHKKENVCGKNLFCTNAMLNAGKKENEIVIENSLLGPGDPEMWISVEGAVAIRVMNLNWRFRGNETLMANNVPIQIFWDVHDWLFTSPGSGHGLFIFKLGSPDSTNTDFYARNCSEVRYNDSKYDNDSPQGSLSTNEYCHYLIMVPSSRIYIPKVLEKIQNIFRCL
ncbi:uncharacterized protein LOC112092993 [Morus notabilis]|uniref:uncharacterized protein LOC112092993 n=1 Tax=Morus notabilis TaxID=981085 RepID=UPI000CED1E39|nr:uncharacterized protein LOC112092993 [Morus notabilis]